MYIPEWFVEDGDWISSERYEELKKADVVFFFEWYDGHNYFPRHTKRICNYLRKVLPDLVIDICSNNDNYKESGRSRIEYDLRNSIIVMCNYSLVDSILTAIRHCMRGSIGIEKEIIITVLATD
jgi:hypothetical protein